MNSVNPRRVLYTVLTLAVPCWAQTPDQKPKTEQKQPEESEKAKEAPPSREENLVRRVFQLKHVDPNHLTSVLALFPVRMQPNPHLKTLSVSGSREMVAAVEETIRRFDVPPPPVPPAAPVKNVDLTVHLLLGQDQLSSEAFPQAVQSVVSQLTSLFPYKSYHLAETLVVRARDGNEGEVSGVIRAGAGWLQAPYRFSFRRATVQQAEAAGNARAFDSQRPGDADKARLIRIDKLELVVNVPLAVALASRSAQQAESKTAYNYQPVGLKTDLDVREGQKVVVGKATLDGAGQALILVVTAKVIDY